MPSNKYKCASCNNEWVHIGPYKDMECPECNTSATPQLPSSINSPSVFEVVDSAHNVKWRDNFQERAAKRNKDGSKPSIKELARANGKDPKDMGWSEDDGKLI